MYLTGYKALLMEVKTYLEEYGDTTWPAQLEKWISLIDGVMNNKEMATFHIRKTQTSLVEQTLSGHLMISPINGHKIENDRKKIDQANKQLIELVTVLEKEINKAFDSMVKQS